MDGLLTVARSRRLSDHSDDALVATERPQVKPEVPIQDIDTHQDVLRILQSQPSFDNLVACLQWLMKSAKTGDGFNIRIPSPKTAPIVAALVNEVVPSYWQMLYGDQNNDHAKECRLLVKCLTSIGGIGGLATRLRELTAATKFERDNKKQVQQNDLGSATRDVIQVLEEMLQGDSTLLRMIKEILSTPDKPMQQQLMVREVLSWTTSGRLVSLVAEADSSLRERTESWLADGSAYSQWLGRNIKAFMIRASAEDETLIKTRTQIFSKALSLGYKDQLIGSIFSGLIRGSIDELVSSQDFFTNLPAHEKKIVLHALMRIVPISAGTDNGRHCVGGVAALIKCLVKGDEKLSEVLIDWFTDDNSGSVGIDLLVHRAIIAVLAQGAVGIKSAPETPGTLEIASNKMLSRFADRLYIEHAPILHQEVHTQDLLLMLGSMHRNNKNTFKNMARSSLYINAVSNRLSASSTRSQFLGMVVGTAISELVDDADKRMKFDIEELNSEESKWYKGLIKVQDTVGTLDQLKDTKAAQVTALPLRSKSKIAAKTASKAKDNVIKPGTSKIVAIEELDDLESDEDDDLPTYEKPDSDAEDSEDDPTLIQRNKPTAPVYIRDLISGLRDTENYDRNRLALSTAASLIRRKMSFGTEVSEHIVELATTLVGLKDSFNLPSFEEQRLRGMISVVVAQPLQMGKWFSTTLFAGDYSMAQRASILTTLSLAARELAGYREDDAPLTGAYEDPKDLFPSKRLPAKMDPRFTIGAGSSSSDIPSLASSPVAALAERQSQNILKPLAAKAADKATGPDILKTRTFSSRMEVEKKRKRPITNELAKIVADGFFFPLTGRYRVHMSVYGSRSSFSTPFLLAHLLKTLALILSASGSSTLSLPALTTEFFGFLMPLRVQAIAAKPVLEAVLFCFLTALEINGNDMRSLAQDHGEALMETQDWAQKVFDNTRGGEKEGEKIRMLAAGVMVKCSEVVESYQQMLMGGLGGKS
jgi:telomere length regulation protein